MLKLKLQDFGHLMQRTNSLEKTLMLEKIEGRKRRRWQGLRWLDGITEAMYMNLRKLQEILGDRETWPAPSMGSWSVRDFAAVQEKHTTIKIFVSICLHCNKSYISPLYILYIMDCCLPSSSVHWILQVRMLEWVAMPSSRVFPNRDRTVSVMSPALTGRFFTSNTTWKEGYFLRNTNLF